MKAIYFKLIVILITILVVAWGLFSLSMEEKKLEKPNSASEGYLDFQLHFLHLPNADSAQTGQQLKQNFFEAYMRAIKYMTYENEEFILKANAETLNVSPELYRMLLFVIRWQNQSSEELQNEAYCLENRASPDEFKQIDTTLVTFDHLLRLYNWVNRPINIAP